MINWDIFESHFGFPAPTELVDLHSGKSLPKAPVVFHFSHVEFIFEIQYWLDFLDPKNYNVKQNRLSFAVNTDGYELLVDLGNEDLQILQNESGDIDHIGLTIKDLLLAKRNPL